ncbi:MAG: P-II family nitrogen regulator [bacterium]|jgi:nitrogen regulatory protein P-II 1|nr:P-II family nitrogen regulator [Betaproteobacteria bacterium]
MKEIKAIVRPARLDRVRDALRRLPGFPGMNFGKVEGCSRYPSGQNPRSPKEALTEFSSKVRIEMVCPDEMVEPIVRVIADNAFTGQAGDGLVWVTDVAWRVRVVEKEADLAALAAATAALPGTA